jgi:hypothetical protein
MLSNNRGCCCGNQNEQFEPSYNMPETSMGMNMNTNMMDPGCGCPMEPIYEAPIEKCVQRNICHEVQHICPVNTKIINNHIFRHTYTPQYSCCEQNVVTNLDQGSCCNFM